MREGADIGRSWPARLLRDSSGGVAILFLFLTMGLFGFVALAIDTSIWYATKRRMQAAADAAARAGAHELQRFGATRADVVASAERDAAKMGFGRAAGATVEVRLRPGDAVEAAITMPARLNFARLFLDAAPVLSARAAAAAPGRAPPCLTLLDATAPQAMDLSDSARITAPTCRVQINSTDREALKLAGGAYIAAAQICVAGGVTGSGTSVPVERDCAPLSDPLAAWTPPEVPPCDKGAQSVTGIRVLAPGVYCGMIDIGSGAVVTFLPGTYHLKDGGLKVAGLAKLTGVGVAFLLSGSSRIEIADKSSVDFVAPVAGPMAGIVFAHTRDAPAGMEHKLVGFSDVRYEGAIYLPRHDLTYQGESSTLNIPPFTTYIVRRLKMDSGSHLILNNNFAASLVPVVGKIGAGVVLVE